MSTFTKALGLPGEARLALSDAFPVTRKMFHGRVGQSLNGFFNIRPVFFKNEPILDSFLWLEFTGF